MEPRKSSRAAVAKKMRTKCFVFLSAFKIGTSAMRVETWQLCTYGSLNICSKAASTHPICLTIWIFIWAKYCPFKGHPHASIMYPRFWAEFLAV